nr:hypothetical protein CFP56_31002 [Quercus suber]
MSLLRPSPCRSASVGFSSPQSVQTVQVPEILHLDEEASPSRLNAPPPQRKSSQTLCMGYSDIEPHDPNAQPLLLKMLRASHPDHDIRPLGTQGGCSLTLLCVLGSARVGSLSSAPFILQIRSRRFALPLPLMGAARRIHGALVAPIEERCHFPILMAAGVQVTQTPVLPGVQLGEIFPHPSQIRILDPATTMRMRSLLSDLATFHARAWKTGVWEVDSSRCLMMQGRVGSSLMQRLAALTQSLPSQALRVVARRALREVQRGGFECLPVVLTHGDLIPSNLLVDAATWRLTGVVDWAEAEWLPFGISLYTVDILLEGLSAERKQNGWFWGRGDRKLREWFWTELENRVDGLRGVRKGVRLARTVGILLWFGFAWDDGRIDRVVDEKAWEELRCLKSLLAWDNQSARDQSFEDLVEVEQGIEELHVAARCRTSDRPGFETGLGMAVCTYWTVCKSTSTRLPHTVQHAELGQIIKAGDTCRKPAVPDLCRRDAFRAG